MEYRDKSKIYVYTNIVELTVHIEGFLMHHHEVVFPLSLIREEAPNELISDFPSNPDSTLSYYAATFSCSSLLKVIFVTSLQTDS